MNTPQDAIAVLDRIEYSGDGFVKRYPSEDEYEEALTLLKNHFEEHPAGESITISKQNFQILMAVYRAAPRPLEALLGMRDDCDTAFEKEMVGRQYGHEETRDAKAWFTSGYNAAATHPQLTLEQYKPNSVDSNYCHEKAIRALRYIGTHGRTKSGGNEFPNDECCFDIAHDLERSWRTIHASLSNGPYCPECKDTGLRDHGGTYPWGEPINLPCDCGLQP